MLFRLFMFLFFGFIFELAEIQACFGDGLERFTLKLWQIIHQPFVNAIKHQNDFNPF
ncbi:Uncharacterised protein [Vibrio cholerae]|nr:Uncharacterised protein [Vibrio cholerae]CSC80054.1 Uncharacterised protein [Vibrio cholerae]